MPMISIDTAVAEGLLYLAPEPKSPHGMDVTPDGKYLVVAGKLDPHVTIYSFDKIQKAIASGNSTPDVYGIPILNFDDVMVAQLEAWPGAAAHPVRRQGQRLHQPVPGQHGRQVEAGRRRPGCLHRAQQGAGAVQHRPPGGC